jgi:type I restriction enzyme S subunit
MRLRELAVLKGGITKGNKRSRTSATRLVPYLRVANVQRGFLDLDEVKEIEADESEINALQLQSGDVLFNEGGDRDKLGRGWIWNGELPICIHQNHVFRARIRDGLLLPKLLSWYGNSVGQSYFLEHGKQTTNLASINLTLLGDLPVPVPPRDEQAALVAEVETQTSRIEAGVAALTRVHANLKRYRASVLKAACEGRLVPTEADLARRESRDYEPASVLLQRILKERRHHWETSELAKLKAKGKPPADDRWKAKYKVPSAPDTSARASLPEGWCWASWAQVGFSQNGRGFPSSEYCEVGTKLLRPGNLHMSGRVEWTEKNTRCMPTTWEEEAKDLLIGPGELVMNLTAQSLKDEFLGRVCVTGPDERCLLNQRLARLTCVVVDPKYVLYLFKSWDFRRFVDRLNSGSLIQHMFTSQLDDFVFPLPPLAEQVRIVGEIEARLSRSDSLVDTIETNIERTIGLRQAVLESAFAGKLTPRPSLPGVGSAVSVPARRDKGRAPAELADV